MHRIFYVACPKCEESFSVDYGIRYADVLLECPWCRAKFAVDEAARLDERWGAGA